MNHDSWTLFLTFSLFRPSHLWTFPIFVQSVFSILLVFVVFFYFFSPFCSAPELFSMFLSFQGRTHGPLMLTMLCAIPRALSSNLCSQLLHIHPQCYHASFTTSSFGELCLLPSSLIVCWLFYFWWLWIWTKASTKYLNNNHLWELNVTLLMCNFSFSRSAGHKFSLGFLDIWLGRLGQHAES